jgi:hypothetical protein
MQQKNQPQNLGYPEVQKLSYPSIHLPGFGQGISQQQTQFFNQQQQGSLQQMQPQQYDQQQRSLAFKPIDLFSDEEEENRKKEEEDKKRKSEEHLENINNALEEFPSGGLVRLRHGKGK